MKGGSDKLPPTLSNCYCCLTSSFFTRKSVVKIFVFVSPPLGGSTEPPLDLPQPYDLMKRMHVSIGCHINMLEVDHCILRSCSTTCGVFEDTSIRLIGSEDKQDNFIGNKGKRKKVKKIKNKNENEK